MHTTTHRPAARLGIRLRLIHANPGKIAPARGWRRWGTLGLLVWLAGTGFAAAAVRNGVAAEPVTLTTPDGTEIVGTLYRPLSPSAEPMPAAVVVHGTAVAHASCGPGLSLPLAKQNMVTLAVDLPGHGRSGGSLPRSWFHDPAATLRTRAAHPEIDAAIAFLKNRPDVRRQHPGTDAPDLVMVGHSLGGWAVTDAGFDRDEVRGVVSIGAAAETCDATRPRNLLIVTGGTDQLCPREKGLAILKKARGGAELGPEAAFGKFLDGTDRRLIYIGRVNHFTELTDAKVTRSTVQWIGSSLNREAAPEPAVWLILLVAAAVAATFGGVVAAAAGLHWFVRRLPQADAVTIRPVKVRRLCLLAVLMTGTVPLAATLGESAEVGPVYFAAPAVVLLTLAAVVCLAVAGRSPQPAGERSSRGYGTGLFLGVAGLLLAFVWFGTPWGLTWAELVPTPQRLLLALALLPLFFPACLGLAAGLQHLAGSGESRWARLAPAAAWVGVLAALTLGHIVFTADWRPLFIVPVALLGVSFLAPLPLWLLPHRPGLSLARAVCHAGAAAWLLGCHLPFVHAG